MPYPNRFIDPEAFLHDGPPAMEEREADFTAQDLADWAERIYEERVVAGSGATPWQPTLSEKGDTVEFRLSKHSTWRHDIYSIERQMQLATGAPTFTRPQAVIAIDKDPINGTASLRNERQGGAEIPVAEYPHVIQVLYLF